MLVSYPALFYNSPNESDSFYVYFPDIKGPGTQGDNVADALYMASEYLGIMAADIIDGGEKLPKASDINLVSLVKDDPFKGDKDFEGFYNLEKSFVSMVVVDVNDYLDGQELIKKTLSIPKWSNDLGNRLNLNFSKVLTEAIEDIALS